MREVARRVDVRLQQAGSALAPERATAFLMLGCGGGTPLALPILMRCAAAVCTCACISPEAPAAAAPVAAAATSEG